MRIGGVPVVFSCSVTSRTVSSLVRGSPNPQKTTSLHCFLGSSDAVCLTMSAVDGSAVSLRLNLPMPFLYFLKQK